MPFLTNIPFSTKKNLSTVDHNSGPAPSAQILRKHKQVYFLHNKVSELQRNGEKVIIVYFMIFPNHSPGKTEGKPWKSSVTVISAMAEIQTRHCPFSSQNHYHLLGLISKAAFLSFYERKSEKTVPYFILVKVMLTLCDCCMFVHFPASRRQACSLVHIKHAFPAPGEQRWTH